METNEFDLQPIPEPELVFIPDAQYYLRQAGRWAYFLGILGFIGTGLILIAAFFIGTIFSLVAKYQSTPYPAGIGGAMSFVYILIAVFYFFFSLYLFQFGDKVKKGILFKDANQVSSGLEKLKSFFKLWGITTIVIISLYILVIIAVVALGVGASLMHSS